MASLDLPFEPVGGDPIPLPPMTDSVLCGGVTVSALIIQVPEVGMMPGLRFNFVAVDGEALKPIIFVTEPDQMRKLRPLVAQAATMACLAAEGRAGV